MAEENSTPPRSPQPGAQETGKPESRPAAPGGGDAAPVAISSSITVTTGLVVAGTYEVEQLISRGGMGEVYRGRNIHTGDPVAMKIVLPALAHDPMIEALFQKEAKVLGRLAHDAIVRYHTYMNPPEIGRPSLIMEFIEGKSLSDRLKEEALTESEARELLRRLASGLNRAHGAGVVHRDLSPDNVLLEGQRVDRPKLIDFGIAKSSMAGDRTLLQGQFAGKFSFVAPEQLGAYDGVIDGRTDIYSLGLMMVAACRGKNLDMGGSIIEAVRTRSSVPDLGDVYPALRPLLEHMLQPDPANRPKTMAKVIEYIDHPNLIPAPPALVGLDDPDRTVIAANPAAISAPDHPAGSSAATAQAEFMGIPAEPIPAAPTAPVKSRKGLLLMASALVVLLAAGGAGAWFAGLIPTTGTLVAPDPPEPPQPEPPQPEPPQPEPPQPDAPPPPEPHGGTLTPMERQLAWLRDYDLGSCAYVATHPGEDDGTIELEGFGTSVTPFSKLLEDYRKTHEVEPNLGVRLITESQCPILDFMNDIKVHKGIMPRLTLDNDSEILKSGETVSGRIEGLAGRSVSLFLVNGAGGSTNLKPWMSQASDGTLGFSFTVNLASGAAPTPQMIFAVVTERPVEKLDAVPNGVTARALVPFMTSELNRERQTALGALRFFRLEN